MFMNEEVLVVGSGLNLMSEIFFCVQIPLLFVSNSSKSMVFYLTCFWVVEDKVPMFWLDVHVYHRIISLRIVQCIHWDFINHVMLSWQFVQTCSQNWKSICVEHFLYVFCCCMQCTLANHSHCCSCMYSSVVVFYID